MAVEDTAGLFIREGEEIEDIGVYQSQLGHLGRWGLTKSRGFVPSLPCGCRGWGVGQSRGFWCFPPNLLASSYGAGTTSRASYIHLLCTNIVRGM